MSRSNKSALARATLLAAAAALTLPGLAQAHPDHGGRKNAHTGLFCFYCGKTTNEAYPNDTINGEHVPAYIFRYADRNNDGVLRGPELNLAVQRLRNLERRGYGK